MTIYYVSANGGSDSSSGTSQTSAFATLQVAANKVQAGDRVEVMDGTYRSGFSITHSGTSSAPITFEAMAGQHPIISAGGQWYGIDINNASWVTIKGFEVVGGAQSVTQSYAESQENNLDNPITAGNGIIAHGSAATHDTIEGNNVHDWSGTGITTMQGDYFSVIGNTVSGNTKWSPYGNSGISLGFLTAADSSTGYHNIISGNIAHDNEELIPFHSVGYISDGNGIIVDSNGSGYNGRTLVENNLSYHNGGSGMHTVNSNHVDFLYNTTYRNDQNINNGEIGSYSSSDIRIENNIMVAAAGKAVDPVSGGSNVVTDYNVYSGGTPSPVGAHSIIADPAFASAGSGDFTLQGSSQAIDKANSELSVSSDILGEPRPVGAGYDIGAYEFQQDGGNPPPPPPVVTPDTLILVLSEDAYKGNAQFIAKVDGVQIAGPTPVTALHRRGQSQDFTYQHAWGAGTHQVEIDFINDAYGGRPNKDRNLYIEKVSYDGASYGATPSELGVNSAFIATVGHS